MPNPTIATTTVTYATNVPIPTPGACRVIANFVGLAPTASTSPVQGLFMSPPFQVGAGQPAGSTSTLLVLISGSLVNTSSSGGPVTMSAGLDEGICFPIAAGYNAAGTQQYPFTGYMVWPNTSAGSHFVAMYPTPQNNQDITPALSASAQSGWTSDDRFSITVFEIV